MEIIAYPAGYLDLVGARTLGKGVSQAADFFQPVVDVGSMLGLQRRFSARHQLPSFAAGKNPFSQLVVPAGKIWKIVAGYVQLTTGAGETVQGAYPYVEPSNFSANIVGLSDSTDLAASQNVARCIRFQDFLVQAGDSFGIFSGTVVGAPDAYLSFLAEEYSA